MTVHTRFLGTNVPCTLRWPFYWENLIVLWLYHLVCALYCGCLNLFCIVWVCVCMGVLVICVLVFSLFCIVCTWFLCFFKCMFVRICFVCASLRTTATECQFNFNVNNSNNNNNNYGIIYWNVMSVYRVYVGALYMGIKYLLLNQNVVQNLLLLQVSLPLHHLQGSYILCFSNYKIIKLLQLYNEVGRRMVYICLYFILHIFIFTIFIMQHII
jgi:hypothetical protein